jgi:hypothetical protein
VIRVSAVGFYLVATVLVSGCGRRSSRAFHEPSSLAPSASTGFEAAPANVAAAPSGAVAAPPAPLAVRTFSTDSEAFAAVLAERPEVLGVGESHALLGTENVEPATRRFTRDLLPRLSGHASDLVIELLLPNPGCQKETHAAAKEQRVVTEHQAKTDQNDYVALGTAAKALGIAPHALSPTCDDLARIGRGGEDAVATSLDVITRLVTELATRLVDRNRAANDSRAVVLYGGALHNDLEPSPARAQWSFGPTLTKKTGGRYVELDLVVPEFVTDSPAWKSLSWVPRFDFGAHGADAALLTPLPRSHVLIFGRSTARTPAAPAAPTPTPAPAL